MDDIFYEQLIKKIPDKRDMLLKIGLYIAAVILMIICLYYFQAIGMLLVFFIYMAASYLNSMLNVEYEYIFTSGELDIDCVYNKARRKRLCTIKLSDAEIMAHIDDKNNIGHFDSAQETKDYSSGVINKNTYCLLISFKGKKTKFILEPNEVMLKSFSRYLTPRKLFIKK